MKKFLIIIGLWLCFLSGQVTSDYLYKGPRTAALAGSSIGRTSDGWAIFNNPAGLSQVEGMSIVAGSQKIFNLSFLPYTMAGGTFNLKNAGVIGAGVETMSVKYDAIKLTSETAIRFSHGFYLQKDVISSLAFGYSLKFFQLDYGQSAGPSGDGTDGVNLGKGNAIGLDIGLQASLRDRHWIGVFVSNINRPKIGEGSTSTPLPQRLQAGFGYSPYSVVWTYFSLTKAVNHDTQYHAGIEYYLFKNIRLMFGTHSGPSRFGAGISADLDFFNISYGLITHPVLPLTHQFSFGANL